jgi:flagellar biosynthesis/type III secretory pathway protein FliH
MRMERSAGPESLREALVALKEKLGDKKYQSLNRAFVVWIRRVLLNRMMPQEPIPEANDLEEVETMLAERVEEWTEKWKMEGLQKGRIEGRIEGRMEGRMEGIQIGEQKGRQEGLCIVARNALRKQMSHDDVAELTGLSLEDVQRLASDLLQ